MRQIVVGQLVTNAGIQQISVWYRFPITGASRQAYFAKAQAGYSPAAPGDYASTGADQAEIAAFQAGQWIERAFFADVIDPTASLAQIQARLANIYNAAAAAETSLDNSQLARWGSSWDGTSWTMKSA